MRERGKAKLLTIQLAIWGLCLASLGCISDLDFIISERSTQEQQAAGAQKNVAQRYTEEPRDRARRAWQIDDQPTPRQSSDIAQVGATDEKPRQLPPIQTVAQPMTQPAVLPTALVQPTTPVMVPTLMKPQTADTITVAAKPQISAQPAVLVKPSAPVQTSAQSLPENPDPVEGKTPNCANGGPASETGNEVESRRIPTELAMESHPPYVIEPPDVLWIDTVQMIPRSPYTVQALDMLLLRATETLPNQPIDGAYTVSLDGRLNLGFSYGGCRVAGMSMEQVEEAVRMHLGKVLNKPQVAVSLGQFRGVQQVRGEHLVKADGTISLGNYGSVYVTGMTIQQAKCAIERYLTKYVQDPEVSLDVFAFNSKAYYVIADGGGYGQIVLRFPVTGKETVLDAIGQIQGLPAVASKHRIWVARPAPADHECVQILPVDWNAITQGGSTGTNYQLFPGDRIYVKADCLITIDNWLAKALSPVERLFGVTLLGTATVQTIRNNNFNNNTGFIATVR